MVSTPSRIILRRVLLNPTPRRFITTTPNHPHINPTSPVPPPPPSPSSSSSSSSLLLKSTLLSLGIFTGVISSYFLPRPQLLNLLYPLPTPVAPVADSEEGIAWTLGIEKGLQELKVVRELRMKMQGIAVEAISDRSNTTPHLESSLVQQSTLLNGTSSLQTYYTESRPYAASVAGPHSLSASTLKGPGKFAVPPLVFTSRDKKEGVFIMHLGAGLCGHEGVIHGGLLATVLDEALGRTAFFALPSNIGVTATLNVAYKKPTFANQYVVIRTKLSESKGRKAWVKARLEDLDGGVLVEAEALFVEPRLAKFLNTSSVREHLK